MNTEKLIVLYNSKFVGTIWEHREGSFAFSYSPQWLSDPGSFAISLSLPLSEKSDISENAHRFFSNLLPEGRLRYLVTRRLGISEDNDFELLKIIGGECAGALTIVPENDSPPETDQNHYRPISPAELLKLEKEGPVFPVIANSSGIRLSLAGAQDKLPLLYKNNDLFLPLGRSPSSHILKFSNRDFKYLPANEVITTWIAEELDLKVVKSTLFDIGNHTCCLIERYDRRLDINGNYIRLHQEDFCQALGYSSFKKYEQEAGPSFAQCFTLITNIPVILWLTAKQRSNG